MQHTQSYLMLFAYGVLLIGVFLTIIGWFLFKLRALRNKPAWEGIGGKMLKLGLWLVLIGIILVGVALYALGSF
jgi:cytochrome b561